MGVLEGRVAAVTCGRDGGLAYAVAAALAREGAATTLLGRVSPGVGAQVGAPGALTGTPASAPGPPRGTPAGAVPGAPPGAATSTPTSVPAGCAAIEVDLLDPADVERAIGAAAAWGARGAAGASPRLDVLCNLAAAEIAPGRPLHEIGEAEWDGAVAETVRTALLASRYAVPLMRRSGGGSIVNLSHSAALVGVPGTGLLAATAGTLLNMTRAMAATMAGDGIRVNCVCLGGPAAPVASGGPEAHRAEPVSPAELAPLFVFLAGDGARHVNGQVIPADGGMTAWR